MFVKNRIDISKINKLGDLENIPVTTKDDLQLRNNDFICVDKKRIIDYITTSGTLGDPVTFVQTDGDLDRLAYNEATSFACANCSDNDIIQLMTTIDRRFMAGLAYFLGVRKLGAGIVRVGSRIPELQWDSIERFKSTVLITVPSFLLKIIEYAELNNLDYNNSSVRSAICIGEPLRDSNFQLNRIGTKIKDKWDIDLFSTYASTEMSTAFTECVEGRGGHHHPELIIVEFLDDNNNPVNKGELGEVTISTLGIEGMPLLRFKTGDLCTPHYEPCACGKTTMRLGPVIGRKQQMIKYKGTTIYPPAIFDLLDNVDDIKNYYIEIFTNSIGTDEILIKIGCDNPPIDFEMTIKDNFRTKLRVAPIIKIESIESVNKIIMPEGSRKPILFFDRREGN
jgi:phenylacetate-CoA ligase